MSKIKTLIENFSTNNLISFLRDAIPSFKPEEEELDHLFQEDVFEKYESIIKIGEAEIDKDDLIVIASKTNEPLTERTGKRNQYEIAKTILKHEVKDASLFVFYDDEGNFRFSFVKANYLGTKRDFTDFKRYTYFITSRQTNKTFIKQVGGCNFDTLEEIVEAFSVEPLNKQFYQEIAKSFYNLIGGKVKVGSKNEEYEASLKLPSTSLENNRRIYQEFGVRLIGRTIFCWFLKNKKSDAGIPLVPDDWVSSAAVKENYYHSIVEKLFFLVLNKKQEDRKDSFLLPDNHTQIPFLNGGLFEPHREDFFKNNMADYGLKLPDEWFKNLFETLEQYNFTIDENSIYDAEVSIDPEMLGTIFENLLAEIDPDTEKSARKATGSFYTPREIVDYMVEQSLVQYLKTKLETDKEEQLLELFKEGGENKFGSQQTKQILEALSDVKILDPACGSGAFPMGALNKIINALQKLDPDASWWKQKQLEKIDNAIVRRHLKTKLDGSSSDYARKLGVIQHSIYGVDIQPVAAEISKLRSFLSLVIDENIDDEAVNRGVEPLPNLEFKFVTANTLIGLPEEQGQQFGMFDNFEELEQLKQLRSEYLQSYGNKKEKIKERFLKVQKEAFKKDSNLFTDLNGRSYLITSWNPFKNDPSPWFDPEWMFGVDKFDVVIGNPPYVEAKKLKKIVVDLRNYQVYSGTADLSSYFFERGLDLCGDNGHLCYINTNKFFNTGYGEKVRKLLLENNIKQIINFEQVEVFDGILVSSVVVLTEKSDIVNSQLLYGGFYKLNNREFRDKFVDVDKVVQPYQKKYLSEDEWSFADDSELLIKSKIESISRELGKFEGIKIYRGVTTGYNPAFIIGNDEAEILIKKSQKNKQIIKPLLQGRDIRKWFYKKSSNKLLQTGFDIEIQEQFPDIFNHLNEFKDNLINRSDQGVDWWNLRSCAYNEEFEKQEKIVWGLTADKWAFAYDDKQHYLPSNGYILTSDHVSIKYLLGLLNSNLLKYYFKFIGIMTAGGAYTLKHGTIKKLPFPKEFNEMKIKYIVDEILKRKNKNEDIQILENKLNTMVYKLYNLTHEEVLIIDPEFSLTNEEYDNYEIN